MILFADMGGKKFKLGRIMKNAERQKPTALTVSILRDAVSVQLSPGLSLSCCTPFLSKALQPSDQIDNPVSELNVSLNVYLPISVYVNGCVTSINMLSHVLAILKLPPQ